MADKAMPTGSGTFCWMELMTGDVDRAVAFYTGLFGWTTEEMPLGPEGRYVICKRGPDMVAGVMRITEEMGPVPPHWLSYVSVVSVDASTAQVRELGGKVLAPPMDIPGIGRFSVVEDPTGGVFALFQGLS